MSVSETIWHALSDGLQVGFRILNQKNQYSQVWLVCTDGRELRVCERAGHVGQDDSNQTRTLLSTSQINLQFTFHTVLGLVCCLLAEAACFSCLGRSKHVVWSRHDWMTTKPVFHCRMGKPPTRYASESELQNPKWNLRPSAHRADAPSLSYHRLGPWVQITQQSIHCWMNHYCDDKRQQIYY